MNGVYLGWCERGGRFYRAMINIGYNPTFHNQLLSVEAHLLDFDEEIYGESIRLHFADRLREERKFDGIDALKEQLKQDREAAARLPERF
jgi:riboflavin kinase/FMN adenylyltransferase